jgi:hypothetical protein
MNSSVGPVERFSQDHDRLWQADSVVGEVLEAGLNEQSSQRVEMG